MIDPKTAERQAANINRQFQWFAGYCQRQIQAVAETAGQKPK